MNAWRGSQALIFHNVCDSHEKYQNKPEHEDLPFLVSHVHIRDAKTTRKVATDFPDEDAVKCQPRWCVVDGT
jgi:hypothetical protein